MPVGGQKNFKVGVYIKYLIFGGYIAKFSEKAPNIAMMKGWAEIC